MTKERQKRRKNKWFISHLRCSLCVLFPRRFLLLLASTLLLVLPFTTTILEVIFFFFILLILRLSSSRSFLLLLSSLSVCPCTVLGFFFRVPFATKEVVFTLDTIDQEQKGHSYTEKRERERVRREGESKQKKCDKVA